MFTGIVEGTGVVARVESIGGDVRLTVRAEKLHPESFAIGESIAVNGACLTASALVPGGFVADVSRETARLTTLGTLTAGAPLNLERSLTLATPLSGHLVSGHVDGVGRIISRKAEGRSLRLSVAMPPQLARYVARKGSICVDGVSLTINETEGATFVVNIVPHTAEATIIGTYGAGTAVNIEVDLLARYLEKLLQDGVTTPGSMSADLMRKMGYGDEKD